jgi:hypothetical protein
MTSPGESERERGRDSTAHSSASESKGSAQTCCASAVRMSTMVAIERIEKRSEGGGGSSPVWVATEWPRAMSRTGFRKTFAAQYFCQNSDSCTGMWCKRTPGGFPSDLRRMPIETPSSGEYEPGSNVFRKPARGDLRGSSHAHVCFNSQPLENNKIYVIKYTKIKSDGGGGGGGPRAAHPPGGLRHRV